MNNPQERLSTSQGDTANSVLIYLYTKSDEILQNLTTGHRTLTGRSTPFSLAETLNFCLRSSSPRDIEQLLRGLLVSHLWLCEDLASKISTAATNLGFGRNANAFTLTIHVAITYYQKLVDLSDPPPSNDHNEALLRMVLLETRHIVLSDPPPPVNDDEALILRMILLGKIKRKDLKSLKMDIESCSICLDDLSGSSKHGDPTRMDCSHVFHSRCILEWLHRKNTCPMCRTVLYESDQRFGNEEN